MKCSIPTYAFKKDKSQRRCNTFLQWARKKWSEVLQTILTVSFIFANTRLWRAQHPTTIKTITFARRLKEPYWRTTSPKRRPKRLPSIEPIEIFCGKKSRAEKINLYFLPARYSTLGKRLKTKWEHFLHYRSCGLGDLFERSEKLPLTQCPPTNKMMAKGLLMKISSRKLRRELTSKIENDQYLSHFWLKLANQISDGGETYWKSYWNTHCKKIDAGLVHAGGFHTVVLRKFV